MSTDPRIISTDPRITKLERRVAHLERLLETMAGHLRGAGLDSDLSATARARCHNAADFIASTLTQPEPEGDRIDTDRLTVWR